MPVDYQKGQIYSLQIGNYVFVGSTTQSMLSKVPKNKEILKIGKPTIKCMEKYPCESRKELKCREFYWIRKCKEKNFEVLNGKTVTVG